MGLSRKPLTFLPLFKSAMISGSWLAKQGISTSFIPTCSMLLRQIILVVPEWWAIPQWFSRNPCVRIRIALISLLEETTLRFLGTNFTPPPESARVSYWWEVAWTDCLLSGALTLHASGYSLLEAFSVSPEVASSGLSQPYSLRNKHSPAWHWPP